MPNNVRSAEGFRFGPGGLNTKSAPDAKPVTSYNVLSNVRAYSGNSYRTRPGHALVSHTNTGTPELLSDIKAYTSLNDDDIPIILGYSQPNARVFRMNTDPAVLVGGLSGSITPGASMIPYRPNASPNPWMYIANGSDYQKFSAPDPVSSIVTQQKAGIAEPQYAPDAVVVDAQDAYIDALGAPWTPGGTAGAATGQLPIIDTPVAVFYDPADNRRASCQVTTADYYRRYMGVFVSTTTTDYFKPVQDVFPPWPQAIAINAIYYFNSIANVGRCVVYPAGLGPGPENGDVSINSVGYLNSLRRGALVKIGTEVCLVWSVTTGPDGTVCFETSTVANHTAAEPLTTVPTVVVLDSGNPTVSSLGFNHVVTASATVGIGTWDIPLSGVANPFAQIPGFTFQQDDYVHITLNLDNPQNLNELKIIFSVGAPGSPNYTENGYYYTIRPADIIAGIENTLTQLAVAQIVEQRNLITEEVAASELGTQVSGESVAGLSQWSEILFPISAMTRFGNDQMLNLSNVNGIQILVNANATIGVTWTGPDVFGGYQADVGDNGAPYRYRVRPRSSVTGAVGNPSPASRYGVSPRRELVNVVLPNVAPYDPQIDTWDIFRYGGSITSWRFIGSIPSSSISFLDNYFDDTAEAGDELDFDNLEPWPSIDLPVNATALNVCGTTAILDLSSLPAAQLQRVSRYLPGTLLQLGSQNVYTLWNRPVPLSGNSIAITTMVNTQFSGALGRHYYMVDIVTGAPHGLIPGQVFAVTGTSTSSYNQQYTVSRVLSSTEFYAFPNATVLAYPSSSSGGTLFLGTRFLFQFLENADFGVNLPALIREPILGNQPLLYTWGPNEYGDVFAVGDPLRAGTAYWIKRFNPDSAPDTNNVEITAPQEPLLGGEVLDGVSLVASSERWWRLIPGGTNGYTPVQLPVPRGIAAPFAYATDGKDVYFVAKDGVWSLARGSLTDADLYNLFPHEGVQGRDVSYGPYTFYAPNYAAAATFRLAFCNGFLFFDYQDSTNTQRTLVLNLATGAWISDSYSTAVTVHYSPETQEGTLQTSTALYPTLFLANAVGQLAKEQDFTNDMASGMEGTPISAAVGTAEWDGGDTRNVKLWADAMLDVLPSSPVSVTPMSGGAAMVAATVIAAGARLPALVNLVGAQRARFCGLLAMWTDDFNSISTATNLYIWAPSIWAPVPETAQSWSAEPTSFGWHGFGHIGRLIVTYIAAAPVTLGFTVFDGTAPASITLPATAGVKKRLILRPTFNKGLLYTPIATSSKPFLLWLDDTTLMVKEWNSAGPYVPFNYLRAGE